MIKSTDQAPLVSVIREGIDMFVSHYGFKPEKMHISQGIHNAIMRWLQKEISSEQMRADLIGKPLEFMGLEVVFMTKRSQKPTEFWMSATRGGQVYAIQLDVEPHEVGATKVLLPGEVILDSGL